MREQLEQLYESELAFARRLALEFAQDRPQIAGHLGNGADLDGADPHVERFIEGFALLTARTRLKLHDEFPRLTDALLSVLFPYYLAPLPSMGLVQFDPELSRSDLTPGFRVPRGCSLRAPAVDGVACRFRTTADLRLWPLEIVEAGLDHTPFERSLEPPPQAQTSDAVFRIKFRSRVDQPLSAWGPDRLPIFLNGDSRVVHGVYEALFNEATAVVLVIGRGPRARRVVLGPECLKPCGFAEDEAMLPPSDCSFRGFRLLAEYFAFPTKFQFVQLDLSAGRRPGEPGPWEGCTDEFELQIFCERSLEQIQGRIGAQTFQLNCVPIVNLFRHSADPINASHLHSEYQVIPDVQHPSAIEIYSVDQVESLDPETMETVVYSPFYAFKHARDPAQQEAYWYSRRIPSAKPFSDRGFDTMLSLVNVGLDVAQMKRDVILVKATCTNRDLPAKLRSAGGAEWEFDVADSVPVRSVRPVVKLTDAGRIPDRQSRWRLVTHLALQHMELDQGLNRAEPLRELLRLYDYRNSDTTRQQIEGLVGVRCEPDAAIVRAGMQSGYCRGVRVTLEFDERQFVGNGCFLMAMVLDRFLASFAAINSFTRVQVKTRQREGLVCCWPARSSDRELE